MKKGDEVQLVDGKGKSAIAQITDDHPKRCLLNIIHSTSHAPLRSYYLHIAVAPTKNSERIEWFIEKAVEAGIDEITFIECENGERAKVNMERCEKIAISAMKQSKQFRLPKINALVKLDHFLSDISPNKDEQKWIAWCEEDVKNTFHRSVKIVASSPHHFTVVIGPEGDFTKEEIRLATTQGYQPVSFGENRLRTETAALYACMALNVLCS